MFIGFLSSALTVFLRYPMPTLEERPWEDKGAPQQGYKRASRAALPTVGQRGCEGQHWECPGTARAGAPVAPPPCSPLPQVTQRPVGSQTALEALSASGPLGHRPHLNEAPCVRLDMSPLPGKHQGETVSPPWLWGGGGSCARGEWKKLANAFSSSISVLLLSHCLREDSVTHLHYCLGCTVSTLQNAP